MEKNYSIIWSASEGVSWFIRAIEPDGLFYGDIRFDSSDASLRRATAIEGVIPPDDWVKCRQLIAQIDGHADHVSGSPSAATLSSWTDSLVDPTIILRYNPGDETESQAAQLFRELKSIIEREVSKDYDRIT